MKQLLALAGALAAAFAVTAWAQASPSTGQASVLLEPTALGSILVDSRGRTLYLFEKDRGGASSCDTSCSAYWPKLTSRGVPRAGTGLRQSLLRVTRSHQLTYAGHPLYRFVGDKRPGQTAGEGLDAFGAEWYAIGAAGHSVEPATPPATPPASGGYGGYGG